MNGTTINRTFTSSELNNITRFLKKYKHHDYYGPVATGIFGTWLVIIIILSILGNLIVIIVILRTRSMRTAKNGTNLFLLNLAISDMMVGICMAPVSLNTLIYEEWQFPAWACSLNSFLNSLFLVVSIHTLMYMSLHKYFSLKRHAKCDVTFISRKICLGLILLAWLWGTLLGVLAVTGLSRAVYHPKKLQCGPMYPKFILKDALLFFVNFTFNIIIPFIIMAITFKKIFDIIKESCKFRRQSTCGDNISAKDRQVAITLVVVLAVFIICWFPYIVYIFYCMIIKNKRNIPAVLNPIAYCSGFTNSICNPFIYGLRSNDFKKGYKRIFEDSVVYLARATGRPYTLPDRRQSECSNQQRRISEYSNPGIMSDQARQTSVP